MRATVAIMAWPLEPNTKHPFMSRKKSCPPRGRVIVRASAVFRRINQSISHGHFNNPVSKRKPGPGELHHGGGRGLPAGRILQPTEGVPQKVQEVRPEPYKKVQPGGIGGMATGEGARALIVAPAFGVTGIGLAVITRKWDWRRGL